MSETQPGQKRAYFRLRYPAAEGPTVAIGDTDYEVLDISEKGTRIKIPGGDKLTLGQPVKGALRFRDGAIVPIEGEVSRIDGDQGALKLTSGISLRRMMAEQRQILQRHPETLQEEGERP